jgi:hypothetical protein
MPWTFRAIAGASTARWIGEASALALWLIFMDHDPHDSRAPITRRRPVVGLGLTAAGVALAGAASSDSTPLLLASIVVFVAALALIVRALRAGT